MLLEKSGRMPPRTGKKSGQRREGMTEETHHITWKLTSIFSTASDLPPKASDTEKFEVEPPITERSPQYFSKNPRCWTTHLVKIKIPIIGRYQRCQKVGVNFMGGEDASPTNPDKGRAGNFKTNIQTVQEKRRLVITNARLHGPG